VKGAVNLQYGSLNHCHFISGYLDKPLKISSNTPIPKATADRGPIAERIGKIAPPCALPYNPKYGLQKQKSITASPNWICSLGQPMLLDLRPLAMCDEVAVNRHPIPDRP